MPTAKARPNVMVPPPTFSRYERMPKEHQHERQDHRRIADDHAMRLQPRRVRERKGREHHCRHDSAGNQPESQNSLFIV